MAYPVLADLKAWLGISATSEDTTLTTLLNSAVAFVERYTGRSFVAAAGTREFPVRPPFVSKDRFRLWVAADLINVSTLVNGDGTTLSSGDYYLESPNMQPPYNVIALERSSATVFYSTNGDRISVSGDWGYSANCPDDVFGVILSICAEEYRRKVSGGGTVNVASRSSGVVLAAGSLDQVQRLILEGYRL